jgi:hypothetical protein
MYRKEITMQKIYDEIVNILIILILVNSAFVQAEELKLSDYRQNLQVGQIWIVEVEKESEPPSIPKEFLKDWKPTLFKVYYQFLVEEQQNIDNELCYVIRIDEVSENGEKTSWRWFYKIFIRANNYTLKRVQRLSKDGSLEPVTHNFSIGPVDATDWVGILPMDFPYFEPNAVSYEPQVEVIDNGKLKKRPLGILSQEVKPSEVIINKEKKGALEIILKDKTANEVKHETTQIWVKGMPWWIEAVQQRNGKQWCTARLIKYNKNDIVSQKPEDVKK